MYKRQEVGAEINIRKTNPHAGFAIVQLNDRGLPQEMVYTPQARQYLRDLKANLSASEWRRYELQFEMQWGQKARQALRLELATVPSPAPIKGERKAKVIQGDFSVKKDGDENPS